MTGRAGLVGEMLLPVRMADLTGFSRPRTQPGHAVAVTGGTVSMRLGRVNPLDVLLVTGPARRSRAVVLLVARHALDLGGAVAGPGVAYRTGQTSGEMTRMQKGPLRSLYRPGRNSRTSFMAPDARDRVAQSVVTRGAFAAALEPDSAMLLERRMTCRTGKRGGVHVRSVIERSAVPDSTLLADSQVAAETDILAERRTDVHRRHFESDTTGGSCLLHELE